MPRQTSTAQRLRTGPSRSDRASSHCPSTLTGENIRQAQRGQPPKDFGTRPLTGAGASGGAVSGPPEGTQQWPRMTNDDHSAVAAFRPGPARTQAARFGIKTQGKKTQPFSSPPSRSPALELRMSSGGIGSTGEAREPHRTVRDLQREHQRNESGKEEKANRESKYEHIRKSKSNHPAEPLPLSSGLLLSSHQLKGHQVPFPSPNKRDVKGVDGNLIMTYCVYEKAALPAARRDFCIRDAVSFESIVNADLVLPVLHVWIKEEAPYYVHYKWHRRKHPKSSIPRQISAPLANEFQTNDSNLARNGQENLAESSNLHDDLPLEVSTSLSHVDTATPR